MRYKALAVSLLAAGLATTSMTPVAQAAERCAIATSKYVGWAPALYIQDTGIAAKWGKKYNVNLSIQYFLDYAESINQYTTGRYDGVTITETDVLLNPANGGKDTTFLVVGDFSDGNDAVLVIVEKGQPAPTVKDLKGKKIKLAMYTVSHQLLLRALASVGLTERDVELINVSDADIGGKIAAAEPGEVFVTWNPMVQNALEDQSNVVEVYSSKQTPGEIIDGIAVHTNTSDACKKAFTGAWYEGMTILSGSGPQTETAIAHMAKRIGVRPPSFMGQLRTTRMFYSPAEGAEFARSQQLKETMPFVAGFIYDHGQYSKKAKDAGYIGIQYPDGSIYGNPQNVKLRFDTTYMDLAAQGKL